MLLIGFFDSGVVMRTTPTLIVFVSLKDWAPGTSGTTLSLILLLGAASNVSDRTCCFKITAPGWGASIGSLCYSSDWLAQIHLVGGLRSPFFVAFHRAVDNGYVSFGISFSTSGKYPGIVKPDYVSASFTETE
jgi:hypothetical protein